MDSQSITYINTNAARSLYKTAGWHQFFSVLSFIGALFMLTLGVGISFFSVSLPNMALPGWIGVIYIVFSGIYIFIGLLMWRFGSTIKKGLLHNDETAVEQAFHTQKMMWIMFGIITLLSLVVVFLMSVISAIATVGATNA